MTFAPGSRLEKIGAECFQNTGIERITIPKGVTKIQTRTFYNCKKLVEVTFEAGSRLQTIGKEGFGDCYGLTKIHLPERLKRLEDHVF